MSKCLYAHDGPDQIIESFYFDQGHGLVLHSQCTYIKQSLYDQILRDKEQLSALFRVNPKSDLQTQIDVLKGHVRLLFSNMVSQRTRERFSRMVRPMYGRMQELVCGHRSVVWEQTQIDDLKVLYHHIVLGKLSSDSLIAENWRQTENTIYQCFCDEFNLFHAEIYSIIVDRYQPTCMNTVSETTDRMTLEEMIEYMPEEHPEYAQQLYAYLTRPLEEGTRSVPFELQGDVKRPHAVPLI